MQACILFKRTPTFLEPILEEKEEEEEEEEEEEKFNCWKII